MILFFLRLLKGREMKIWVFGSVQFEIIPGIVVDLVKEM